MAILEDQIKGLGDLTFEDFKRHPVWTLCDSLYDESLAAPIKITHPLHDEIANVLLLLATITLQDDSELDGRIGFNLSNNSAYSLRFYQDEDEFLFGGNLFPEIGTLEQLSEWLGKPVDSITPVRFYTPFVLEDGTHITGEIDLHSW